MERPPIGLMPRWLHDELYFDDLSSQKRIDEINQAICRYNAVYKKIPPEWIEEKKEILDAITN